MLKASKLRMVLIAVAFGTMSSSCASRDVAVERALAETVPWLSLVEHFCDDANCKTVEATPSLIAEVAAHQVQRLEKTHSVVCVHAPEGYAAIAARTVPGLLDLRPYECPRDYPSIAIGFYRDEDFPRLMIATPLTRPTYYEENLATTAFLGWSVGLVAELVPRRDGRLQANCVIPTPGASGERLRKTIMQVSLCREIARGWPCGIACADRAFDRRAVRYVLSRER